MTLYEQLLNTAKGCGIDIIGKRHAAQLMAVTYLYGDESAVYSDKMRVDIRHVQEKYGIMGGRVPDMGFIREIQRHVDEVRQCGRPEWMGELEAQYAVTFPAWETQKRTKEKQQWCTHT